MSAVPDDIEAEYRTLLEQVAEHRSHYYEHDAPTISDSEYDQLERRLRQLEQQYPGIASPQSPTTTVGGSRSEMFEPVEHLQQMYSLDNAFAVEELDAAVMAGEDTGARIKEIPFFFLDRTRGTSKLTLRIGLEALWVVWWLRFADFFGRL